MEKHPPRTIDTETLDLSPAKLRKPQRFAVSRDGMIATQHYLATDAGVEMLKAGGNAIDAAIAAAHALGVCEPAASGLGGQTMMLIHLAKTGRTFALDGSSRAPNLTSLASLTGQDRRRGYRATTVPSTPAVLDYARNKYGTLPLEQVLAPAIRLAEDGYLVTELQRRLNRRERRHLRAGTAATFFLKDGQRTYKVGERFRQPVLAETLKRLAEHGTSDFYNGAIAELIHKDMIRNEGLIRLDDLAQTPRPIERRPLTCNFEGSRVFTFPPPGAGRTLIEMLNIVSHIPAKYRNPDTPRGALCLAHVIQQAFRDRSDRPFDPNFYAQVSRKQMLSVAYAQRVSKQIRKQIRTHGETTHLSVMDRFGNVVALTQSIERVYGSCAATRELGFLYNNYMMAFETENIRHPYYLRPNAAPWASVAPTIILRGKQPWLAIGSPGSERIVSSIMQVLLRLRRQSPFDAVAAPRLHCSLEGKVSLEASCMRSDIPETLQRYGFEIDEQDPHSFYLGCVQLVQREDDEFLGAADPRRDGAAGGTVTMTLPILISVPHAGIFVPPEVRDFCLLTPKQISEDSDEGAAGIYALESEVDAFITTNIARAIVDLNRSESDRTKDGVVKTETSWNTPIYRQPLCDTIIENLLEEYYRPYHRRLTELSTGVKMCFDCHTMAAFSPPIAKDAGIERPHVCLGNAHNTCPQPLFKQLVRCFSETFGRENITVDIPFGGGHIVRAHATEKPWVQIELSRAGFMPTHKKHVAVLQTLQAFSRTALLDETRSP